MKVVIIGGVAGGASCAARLRRLDEKAEIVIFERGNYVSFANCGLPYYIGGTINNKQKLTLETPEGFKSKFNIDVVTDSEVFAIDRNNKKVKVKNLSSGEIYDETYDKLVISTGAKAIIPSVEGIDNKRIFTLRSIPDTYRISDYIEDDKPKKAIIIGGGFIGVEMAENLVDRGIEVTMVEMSNQILAPLDLELAIEVENHMYNKGVKFLLNQGVSAIKEDKRLKVQTTKCTIATDLIVLAIGVTPESELALKSSIEVNEQGYIKTSDNMLTNDGDIYACGDAVEVSEFVTKRKQAIPLAGPANKQGRIVADNIAGINSTFKGTQGTSVAKVFDLTIATTGINEKTAKKLELNYDKALIFVGSHAGYYPGSKQMCLKLIYAKENGKILGAQGVGEDGVEKRIDVIATALRLGGTVTDLTELELSYAPPYSSAKDPVNMLGFVAENMMNGKVKTFDVHEVDDLVKEKAGYFIDVRSKAECDKGKINGFTNIPVEEIRNKIHRGEFDVNKKVYISCQVGKRGYNVSRIFMQYGFDTYNLPGGYRLYSSYKKFK